MRASGRRLAQPSCVGSRTRLPSGPGVGSRHRFAEIQAERACCRAAGAFAAASIADTIAELAGPMASAEPNSPRWDISKVADNVGKSPRTIRRYLSEPRDQYERNSREHSKPWLSQGISRATWYRHNH